MGNAEEYCGRHIFWEAIVLFGEIDITFRDCIMYCAVVF